MHFNKYEDAIFSYSKANDILILNKQNLKNKAFAETQLKKYPEAITT